MKNRFHKITAQDPFGLAITTSSPKAADFFNQGYDELFCASSEASRSFRMSIEADPGFCLAHFLLGRELMVMGDQKSADQCFSQATSLAKNATPRERRHIYVMTRLMTGDKNSFELARDYLREFPADLVVILQCLIFLFWRGGEGKGVFTEEFIRPFQKFYGEDWRFAGVYSHALWEVKSYAHAELLAQKSFDVHGAKNGFALHSLIHVLHGQNDFQGGDKFLGETLDKYQGWLEHHLWWHRSLCALEMGQISRVLDWFKRYSHASPNQPTSFLQLGDEAQLLWRCYLYGHDLSQFPIQTSETLAKTFSPTGMFLHASVLPPTFIPFHAALTFLVAKNSGALEELLRNLESLAKKSSDQDFKVLVAVIWGFRSFYNGKYDETIRSLAPYAGGKTECLGGSHVERDLVGQTLREAYLREGTFEQDSKYWLANQKK